MFLLTQRFLEWLLFPVVEVGLGRTIPELMPCTLAELVAEAEM
jgi:hypothetical protein